MYERSGIVPFNHLSLIDPLVVMRELRRFFPDVPHILLPASMKFYDGRMGESAKEGMQYFANKYYIDLFPLIQHNDTTYSDSDKRKNYRVFFQHVFETLKCPGNIVTLAPEGTRSREGVLMPAQKGIRTMMEKVPDSAVLPISLYGTEQIMGQDSYIPDPRYRAHVTYCYPTIAGDLVDTADSLQINPEDFLMLQIADQLPPEYRGYYDEVHFPWFYDMTELDCEKLS